MAETVDPAETVPGVQDAFKREGLALDKAVETVPPYKAISDEKIPVSKELGKLWQSRLDQAKAARRDTEDCWSEAIRYYENNQMSNRTSVNNASGTRTPKRLTDSWTETENIVFSNATTMLPMLYAKNPEVEADAVNSANEDYAKCCKKLINTLLSMKAAPGVKLKPKARRGVLWALLTNSAYMKIGYTNKEDANETALKELNELTQEYANAKSRKQLQEVEGKLQAIEDKIALLRPAGPSLKLTSPFNIYVDPTSSEGDHDDANWIVECDYLPTYYLNAVYGVKKDGKVVSIYESTHVLKVGETDNIGHDDEINNFSLLQIDDEKKREASHYGYSDSKVYERCQYTKVWWVWDKTTRRVYLFSDKYWTWPVWVWNDPLKLLDFYPFAPLHFYESVDKPQTIGEVTYYLDQQDAINDIHAAIAQSRKWARRNIFYDKNSGLKQDDVDKVLNGPDGTARGIDVPEGKSLKDILMSIVPPAMNYPELLDTTRSQQIIDRITGITAAQRGAEFRTNTTNDAVNFYQQNIDIKVDEKIDAIEDWIADIAWKLLQLLCTKFTTQQVIELIGEEYGQHWKVLQSPEELRTRLSLRIVGGSTDKPTSKNKKRNALEIGQVMGQFSSASPMALLLAAKAIYRAFSDDINITEEEWQMFMQSIEMAVQAQMQPQAPVGGTGNATQGQSSEIDQLVASLPREAQIQLKQLLDQGVPPEQALQQVQQTAQTQQAA